MNAVCSKTFKMETATGPMSSVQLELGVGNVTDPNVVDYFDQYKFLSNM